MHNRKDRTAAVHRTSPGGCSELLVTCSNSGQAGAAQPGQTPGLEPNVIPDLGPTLQPQEGHLPGPTLVQHSGLRSFTCHSHIPIACFQTKEPGVSEAGPGWGQGSVSCVCPLTAPAQPPKGSLSDVKTGSGWERGCPSWANRRMPLSSHGNYCSTQPFRIDPG